jgi:signal transduction histidine kinase
VRRTLTEGRARALDVLIAGALTVWIEIDVLVRDSVAGHPVAVAPLLALQTLPLVWRRDAPLLVVCLAMASVSVHALATGDAPEGGPGFLAMLVALYSVGAHAPIRRALVGLGVVAVAYVIHELNNPNIDTEAQLWSALFAAAITGIVFAAGVYVRRHREAKALEHRARGLEHEREERARTAVAEERARIARELHDIVSHNVSVMVVQAEAAEEVLGNEPARVGEPLRNIQRTGREALVEMRRMLGVLREDGGDSRLAPQPGLAALDGLVEQVGAAGTPVKVTIDGEPRPLPPGVDLTLYRVIQEALTNVLKHAGPADAEVAIRYGDAAVEVEVVDGGAREAPADGAGLGLIGMRERVGLYGGTLDVGARPGGGFHVRARLPLP